MPPGAPTPTIVLCTTLAHAGLAQQGEQQDVPPAGLHDVEEIAHVQRRSLGGELAQLGMGDAVQKLVVLDLVAQPLKALDPQADRLWRRGSGRLLQAGEAGRGAARRLGQQSVQRRRLIGFQMLRNTFVHAAMDIGAQPVHQPVEGAECRQVGCCRLQGLDGPVDEVGRVAHGFGRSEHGVADQVLGRAAVRRHRQVGAYGRLIAIERLGPVRPIGPSSRRVDPELRRHSGHGASVHLVRHWEAAEITAGLEQHCQQQAA